MFHRNSLLAQGALSTQLVATGVDAEWKSMLVEHRRCTEAERELSLRPTPDLHLVVQTNGHQRVEVQRHGRWRTASYGPGSAGLTASGEADRLRSSCEASFDLVHLFLPLRTVQEAAETLRRAGQRGVSGELSSLLVDDPMLAVVANALVKGMKEGAADLYAQQASQWLATHLLITHAGANRTAHEPRRERLSDARLSRAIALVRARFAEPLTLAELASEAGVSKFHFSRLFRERTGKSPHAFLVAERMAVARELLDSTDFSISEVARRTGYAGPVQFASAFRKETGVPPSTYRKGTAAPATD